MREFPIDHAKSSSYHPHENGGVEYFDKILVKGLKNMCNINRDNQDNKLPILLLPYKTAYKILTRQTLFWLVYGK